MIYVAAFVGFVCFLSAWSISKLTSESYEDRWADSEPPDTEGQGLIHQAGALQALADDSQDPSYGHGGFGAQGYRLADIPPKGEPITMAWPQIESPSKWGSM